MKFEVSERITTKRSKEELLNVLEEQFRKVSDGVMRSGQTIQAKSIEASFGSINRTDVTNISIQQAKDGWLIVADVLYKPSIAFWIILIITLFTWVFWLVPIAFYLLQKDAVKLAIAGIFQRIKNEFDQSNGGGNISGFEGTLEEIEKLGSLKDKGLITDAEFDIKKKQILGL